MTDQKAIIELNETIENKFRNFLQGKIEQATATLESARSDLGKTELSQTAAYWRVKFPEIVQASRKLDIYQSIYTNFKYSMEDRRGMPGLLSIDSAAKAARESINMVLRILYQNLIMTRTWASVSTNEMTNFQKRCEAEQEAAEHEYLKGLEGRVMSWQDDLEEQLAKKSV